MSKSRRRLSFISVLTLGLIPLAPSALGSPSTLSSESTLEVEVGGAAGIPSDAIAAAIQVTVTNPSGPGFVTAYPCGSSRPTTSNVNFGSGENRSNLTLVQLGASGRVCFYSNMATDLLVDVSGWVRQGSPWRSIVPARVVDTRTGPSAVAAVAANSVIKVPVSSASAVASDAVAAALNITAVGADNPGFLTVFDCGSALPTSSNVNFTPGAVTPNLAIAPLQDGATCIYSKENVDIIVDVMGWTASPKAFSAIVPQRLTDTRRGLGGTRLAVDATRKVRVGTAPTGSTAVLNVTAVDGSAAGYVTVHPCDRERPATSNTNVMPPRVASTLAFASPDSNGDVCIYTSMSTELVVDLAGWLAPTSGYQAISPVRLVDTRSGSGTVGGAGGAGAVGGSGGGTGVAVPAGVPSVASNFDVNAWLATGERIPGSSAWEPSGSFRTFCEFSHLSYDDPIVYPGQNGAAHLHMFFGNSRADANSTYTSLRSAGSSTCQGGPINRSGYWIPALHNTTGKVVVPEYLNIYYKGNGTQEMIRAIQTNPNGLRMIAGYDPANPNAIPAYWSCGTGPTTGTIPSCGGGQELKVDLRFPMCWNGREIDTANHRSHMAYGTGGGGWVTSQGGCPASHPVHLPELTIAAVYVADGDTRNWYLSSDRMPGMPTRPNGSTFHGDWFGAWDNPLQETWTQKCIREMRNCVWGELGDGTRLQDRPDYTGPRLLDPPPR